MHKRLVGLLAAATIIVAACGASTATRHRRPSRRRRPRHRPAEAPPATPAPTAAPVPPDITIEASNYKAEPVGNKGGKLVVGTSGEPNTIWWGVYDNFAADSEGFGAVALEPVEQHRRLQVLRPARHQRAHRRERRRDARRRRHGRQDRADPGRPVVRWQADHVPGPGRRSQVLHGPDQRGHHPGHAGLRGHHRASTVGPAPAASPTSRRSTSRTSACGLRSCRRTT